MHAKVFSEGEKFPASKKNNSAKMSCGESFGDKISSDENIKHRTPTRREFYAAKFPTAKFPVAKFPSAKLNAAKFSAVKFSAVKTRNLELDA